MSDALRLCPRCAGPLPARGELCPKCVLLQVMDLDLDSELAAEQSALGSIRYLGNYELIEEIARGGMGIVYKARQMTLNRVVAVKLISNGAFASPEMVRRFRAEAEVAASLDHPHIVPIFEIGEHDGLPYFSMGLIEGQTLTDKIAGTALGTKEGANLVAVMARAVHFAHERGVLHRDLKPTNILLDQVGLPHLTDFGLAKLLYVDAGLTRTQVVMGTPAFMAPEQAQGEIKSLTTAADVYGLGAILYHCLTGKFAFEGETTVAIIQQVLSNAPRRPSLLNPKVDRDLETICLKCLQKAPEARYGSAQALAEDLQRWMDGKPIQARPITAVERAAKFVQRHPLSSALALSAVMILLVGSAMVFAQWRRADRERTRAESALALASERLYATHIRLAQQAIEDQDLGRALSLLRQNIPRQGEPDLRGMEWRYLSAQTRGNEDILLSSPLTGAGTCPVFSPDGEMLAWDRETTVELWNIATKKRLRVIELEAEPKGLDFGPDGATLAAADHSGVSLFDLKKAKRLWRFPLKFAYRVKFLPGGERLIVTTGKTSGSDGSDEERALILSARESRTVAELPNSQGRAIALSPDGLMVALGGLRAEVQLWQLEPLQLIQTLTNAGEINGLAFLPDGKSLIGACWGGYLQQWALPTGALMREKKVHRDHIWSLAVGPDATIYTSSNDHTTRAFDPATWIETRKFTGHHGTVFSLAVSPNGRLLAASSGGRMRIWRITAEEKGGAELKSLLLRWKPPVIVADDKLILQSASGPVMVEEGTGKEVRRFDQYQSGAAAGLFNDPKHLMIFMVHSNVNYPTILHLETGAARIVKMDESLLGRRFRGLIYDTDRLLLAGTNSVLYDTLNEKIIREFRTLDVPVFGCAISPDRQYLAAAGLDTGTGRVLRISDGSELGRFDMGTETTIETIAFSTNGTRMAIGSWDHTVKVFSFPDLHEIYHFNGHIGSVYHLAFTHDGRLLSASQDGQTILWDIRTGMEMLRFPSAYCGVLPDGRWVLGDQPDMRTGEIGVRIISAPDVPESFE